jgi:4,5:9,10-diseco-3-hydroxy-5,9,17-trioxoandrosta-1(10),2-diene-4-oate hydrolase
MNREELTKQATDRFVEVEDIIIHFNEAGNGPALMCFHGGGPGANGWDNTRFNFEGLSENFRTLLVDLPGYGESDKRINLNGRKTDAYNAEIILGLMEKLNIRRTHIYASSYSTTMALRFAIDYPDQIGKLVLQCPGLSGGAPLMFQPTPAEGIKALQEFREDPTRERMERIMRLFIPNEEFRNDELVERRLQSAMVPGHIEATRILGGNNSDISKDLSRLVAPSLVLWGHQDWMVPVEGALLALVKLPDVRVHIWGDTGHFVAYERREEFNRLVTDFLLH